MHISLFLYNDVHSTYIEIYLLAELGILAIQRCIENGLRVVSLFGPKLNFQIVPVLI